MTASQFRRVIHLLHTALAEHLAWHELNQLQCEPLRAQNTQAGRKLLERSHAALLIAESVPTEAQAKTQVNNRIIVDTHGNN